MKGIVTIVVIGLAVLALLVIMAIGLDIQSLKFGSFVDAQNINNILINLSYSYVAGTIFYFLVTTIPFYLRKKKINIVVKDRMDIISTSIQTIIFSYDPSSIKFTAEQIENVDLDRLNEQELLTIFRNSTVFNISNVAKQIDPQTNTTILFTVKQSLQVIDNTIQEILGYYLDYLSEEQIILLNKIKSSAFINMIVSSTDNAMTRFMFNQSRTVNFLADEFIVFWKNVKKLNSISK